MSNKNEYYVNSKEFREQLSEYYKSDDMTNKLAMNILKIAEGLSYNHRFIRYSRSWKEEMVGDAVVKMYHALEKKLYNIESEFNPFSYFNRIAWNAFTNRINKEKGQHEGLNEYKEMVYMENMSGPDAMGHVYVKPVMEGDEYDDCETC
jgi:DNA-directed RNA polymerase specialized sigma24 family protein